MANSPLVLRRLDADVARPAFICGDSDIDEFFHKDSIDGCNQLLCVTYALMVEDSAVAFFSVSNDSIKKEDLPRTAFKRAMAAVQFGKRYSSMPASKIGRLGVCSESQKKGYGTQMLDYLKVWFTDKNKTGCRFLLVDAYKSKTRLFGGFLLLAFVLLRLMRLRRRIQQSPQHLVALSVV